MATVQVERLPSAQAAALQQAPFTYDAVGATAAVMPQGYLTFRRSRVLPGEVDFAAAAAALMAWRVQLGAGLRVLASHDSVEPGAVVRQGVGWGSLRVWAPCRVVYVIDEPRRRGFAYGTLPGHPESGEERFELEQRDDDQLCLTVSAFSRPATTPARIGGPATRWTQRRITGRYLHALDGTAAAGD